MILHGFHPPVRVRDLRDPTRTGRRVGREPFLCQEIIENRDRGGSASVVLHCNSNLFLFIALISSFQEYSTQNPAWFLQQIKLMNSQNVGCNVWKSYMGCWLWGVEAILMHNPVSPETLWGFPRVKNQGLLHPHDLVASRTYDLLVQAGRLPVPRTGGPVRTVPIRVFHLPCTKKIPLLLRTACFASIHYTNILTEIWN